jgi:hypothetical protein
MSSPEYIYHSLLLQTLILPSYIYYMYYLQWKHKAKLEEMLW